MFSRIRSALLKKWLSWVLHSFWILTTSYFNTGRFFSDKRFLKNHPYIFFASWLTEKTPGCQEAKVLIPTACSAKQVRCPSFSMVKMHHTNLEQLLSSNYSNYPLLEKGAGSPCSFCKRKWYMDLSGSVYAPRIPCVPAIFNCHLILRLYPSETVWAHFARTYQWGWRAWQFDTT